MAENEPAEKKGCMGWVVLGLIAVAALIIWTWSGRGPIHGGIEAAHEIEGVAQAKAIVQAMHAYAADHGGNYPAGSTSTEIFQKLLDGHYVTESKTFFVLTGGKFPADSNQLDARNVCFDVTAGASSKSPDDLPLVFHHRLRYRLQAGRQCDACHRHRRHPSWHRCRLQWRRHAFSPRQLRWHRAECRSGGFRRQGRNVPAVGALSLKTILS